MKDELAQQITEGIYVGGHAAASDLQDLKRSNISHVLSLGPFQPIYGQHFDYKIVNVEDLPETLIIQHFDECNAFIQEALNKKGRILVHCVAGVSRSCTVVAAYLMAMHNLSAEEALAQIQSIRPMADPNEGFRKQLKVYEASDCKVDVQQVAYRRFLMEANADERVAYGMISHMTLGVDPAQAATTGQIRPRYMKCKKCRRPLLALDNIIEHAPGKGQHAFSYHKRDATLNSLNDTTSSTCTSFFIEPMQWIPALANESHLNYGSLDGRIECPKCNAKLGTFNWAGDQCSCGRWVVPAFMVSKSRVDA